MAEQNQSAQERTEEPTQKRREDARRKGQVPRSRELSTSALLLAAALSLMLFGPAMTTGLADIMRDSLHWQRSSIGTEVEMENALADAMAQALLMLLPFLATCGVVALAGSVALGGFGWSADGLAIKAERLDLIKGVGRMFSIRALVELLKALAKFGVVSAVTLALVWWRMPEMLATGAEAMEPGTVHAAWLVVTGFLLVCASTVLIAAIDIPFQIWNHLRQLRMSRQELKDELRETEGKPEVLSRIRRLQRELARGRMLEEVPRADVVVTNPSHFAVALRWDQKTVAAPKVVARGAGAVAARIREVAHANGVPLFESPALARAIYWSTDIGDEIPAGLYVAVASVLAWVFRLRDPHRRHEPPPPPPSDLPIPVALQR